MTISSIGCHEMAADKGEVDMLVLELAALLHDVDDHKINPGGHVAAQWGWIDIRHDWANICGSAVIEGVCSFMEANRG